MVLEQQTQQHQQIHLISEVQQLQQQHQVPFLEQQLQQRPHKLNKVLVLVRHLSTPHLPAMVQQQQPQPQHHHSGLQYQRLNKNQHLVDSALGKQQAPVLDKQQQHPLRSAASHRH